MSRAYLRYCCNRGTLSRLSLNILPPEIKRLQFGWTVPCPPPFAKLISRGWVKGLQVLNILLEHLQYWIHSSKKKRRSCRLKALCLPVYSVQLKNIGTSIGYNYGFYFIVFTVSFTDVSNICQYRNIVKKNAVQMTEGLYISALQPSHLDSSPDQKQRMRLPLFQNSAQWIRQKVHNGIRSRAGCTGNSSISRCWAQENS